MMGAPEMKIEHPETSRLRLMIVDDSRHRSASPASQAPTG
jgi:hypothetical protein